MPGFQIRCVTAGTLWLAASVGLATPFSGSNPQPGSLTWSGFSNGSVGVTITANGGASSSNVSAGQFQGFFDPASEGDGPGAEADDYFRFFCIDLAQYAQAGPNTYTRNLGVPDATNSAQLTRLFNQFYPNPTTATYYSGGQTDFGSFPSAGASAAFQLALWEIWFDDDMNLATGAFRASSSNAAVITLAQSELNAVGTGSTPAPGWTFYEFNSRSKQDYLSVVRTLRTVPEPGTLALLSIAVLSAWWIAMRRRQTA